MEILRRSLQLVDVDERRELWQLRLTANEAFGMRLPRIEQDEAASGIALVGATMMNVARCQQRDTAVPVILVVPSHELVDLVTRLLDIRKMARERWRVLECFELRFPVGIVVRNVRARAALRDPEIGEELRERF